MCRLGLIIILSISAAICLSGKNLTPSTALSTAIFIVAGAIILLCCWMHRIIRIQRISRLEEEGALRLQAEKNLKDNEAKLKSLIDLAVDTILLGNEHGVITSANQQASELTGYNQNELIGKNIEALFTEEERKKVPLRYDLLKEGKVVRSDRELTRKDGTVVPIEMNSKMMPDGSYQTFMRDMTQRTQSEQKMFQLNQELQRQLRFTEALLSAIPTAVFYKDPEGLYLGCNRVFADIMGVTSDQIKGKTVFDLWPSEHAMMYHQKDIELMNNPKLQKYEWKISDKNGQELDVIYSKNVFYDEMNKVAGLVGAFTDITAQKNAEKILMNIKSDLELRVEERTLDLKAAIQEAEAFNYTIAHDLGAPLRALNGYAGILQKDYADQLDPDAMQYLHDIERNAIKMSNLVEDLLAFSRLSQQHIKKQKTNLTELVRDVVKEVVLENDARKVDVNIENLPECLADPALLRQIWVNLVSNAYKYTAGINPAAIQIGSQIKQGHIVYYIKDNGIGFDMKFHDKIFAVFQRLVGNAQFPGTGAGLAIVKRIITRHNGRVWAESEPGQGATFYFTLG